MEKEKELLLKELLLNTYEKVYNDADITVYDILMGPDPQCVNVLK